eukprot:445797-Amphidinium_carterae.1
MLDTRCLPRSSIHCQEGVRLAHSSLAVSHKVIYGATITIGTEPLAQKQLHPMSRHPNPNGMDLSQCWSAFDLLNTRCTRGSHEALKVIKALLKCANVQHVNKELARAS